MSDHLQGNRSTKFSSDFYRGSKINIFNHSKSYINDNAKRESQNNKS